MAILDNTSAASSNRIVSSSATNFKGKGLDKDAFLKILVTQLKYQDPMAPMQDREFISQMAQFSSLEQMTNVASGLEKLQTVNTLGSAQSLIGATVTYKDAAGNEQTGAVSAAEMVNGVMQVKVGSDLVNLANIIRVTG